ncbi:MAG: hypothetical protein QNJ15_04125 [Erythrobacter sp.]|nr:hypothetical protein [Erythrobacter sp.]
MDMIAWLKTILSMIAITAGLTYGSYVALRHIPALPPSKRTKAMGVFIAAYLVLAFILATAAASVLAAPSGERAHMEASLREMKEATEDRRRAAATINNRLAPLSECNTTANRMSLQEAATGAFSREGGDVGRVATTLANIADACEASRVAIFGSRARLSRLFARIDSLLLDTRRIIDSDMARHAKLVEVRRSGDEFARLTRAVNDALQVEAMQAVGDAMRRDWYAAGLPASGAAAIVQNFEGLAETLTEGMDDIAVLKQAEIPSVDVHSNVTYLRLYPQATLGAIAVGAFLELIPLGGILLGFMILSSRPGRPTKRREGSATSEL